MAIRQRGLSIAYQHPALVPDLTVYENIAMWLPGQVREAGKDAGTWARPSWPGSAARPTSPSG